MLLHFRCASGDLEKKEKIVIESLPHVDEPLELVESMEMPKKCDEKLRRKMDEP